MTPQKLREHAESFGAPALDLIKEILIRHDMSSLTACKEAVDAAVLAEREACAKQCENVQAAFTAQNMGSAALASYSCAEIIRARTK